MSPASGSPSPSTARSGGASAVAPAAPAVSPPPARGLASRLAKRGWYAAAYHLVRPVRDAWRTAAGTHPVRLFTWHRITGLVRDGMTLDPARLARQLDEIRRTHDVVPWPVAFEALAGRRHDHGPRRQPMAVLTFDDAYRSVYTEAFPLLAARGLVATLFVPTDFPGTDARFPHDDDCPARAECDVMSWEEVADLAAHGWTIGGHTASHARLRAGDLERSRDELRRCLDVLLARGYGPSPPMAFCFGRADDCPRDAAAAALAMGYSAVCTALSGEVHAGADLARLRRLDVGGDHPDFAWRTWLHGLVPGAPGPDA